MLGGLRERSIAPGAPERASARGRAPSSSPPVLPVTAPRAAWSPRDVLALQRSAGNTAVVAALAGPRSPSTAPGAVVQRDAKARETIATSIATATDPTARSAAITSAFLTLNGMAMPDLLLTVEGLRQGAAFEPLATGFGLAIGVNGSRLRLAFDAALARSAGVPVDGFVFRQQSALLPLPVDQRKDVVDFFDPRWIETLRSDDAYDLLVQRIRGMAAYTALKPEDKALADEIMALAKTLPAKQLYFMRSLERLLETPEKPPEKISEETNASTAAATEGEAKRLSKPAAAKGTGIEEAASRSTARRWTQLKGAFGGVYWVDRTDVHHIVVKAKVHLHATGQGRPEDVAEVRAMEDGIEKAAARPGYVVDLVFVDAPASDVFDVEVDPGRWEVANNWAGGEPLGFAHELHHLMAFTLDRYDYIESHAANQNMVVHDRLHWFREEMRKPDGYNDPTSIMSGAPHPNDDDVCRIAGLDPAKCTVERHKRPRK